jgi:hypothetical protein
VVAVKSRRIEPAIRFDPPPVLAKFDHKFRHRRSVPQRGTRRRCMLTAFARTDSPDCQNIAFVLLTTYNRQRNPIEEIADGNAP